MYSFDEISEFDTELAEAIQKEPAIPQQKVMIRKNR